MECEKLPLALLYSWVGDSKEAERISKECIESLRESISSIKNKVREVRAKIERDYELPEALRQEGIESDDLVKLALYELSRRMFMFTDGLKAEIYKGVKYSIVNHGYKVIIKGYCSECKGYKLKKDDSGFMISFDGLIYGEFIGPFDKDKFIKIIEELK